MRFIPLLGLVLLAIFCAMHSADAQVHRCIGSSGEPVFTDQPCGTQEPSIGVADSANGIAAADAGGVVRDTNGVQSAGTNAACPRSPQALRERLGWELLAALADGEGVERVVDAGGPGRGPVRLVVTDRRLLWLLEDAVSARVDWVRFGLIAEAGVRRPLLRRRHRTVRLRTTTGRRVAFGDLDPASAAAIVQRLQGGLRSVDRNAL